MNFWKNSLSLLGRYLCSLSTFVVFNGVIMILPFPAVDIWRSITYLTLEMAVTDLAAVRSKGDISGQRVKKQLKMETEVEKHAGNELQNFSLRWHLLLRPSSHGDRARADGDLHTFPKGERNKKKVWLVLWLSRPCICFYLWGTDEMTATQGTICQQVPPKILDDRNFSCDRGLGGEDGLVKRAKRWIGVLTLKWETPPIYLQA